MVKKGATRPRVYARVRPMFGRDAGKDPLFSITDHSLSYVKEAGGEVSQFNMDRVFGMESTQEEVYATIGDTAIQTLRQGFNSTIMAYGQTGSGKTFSMEGQKDERGQYTSRGLIPRLFDGIFESFQGDETVKSFKVTLQFIELYNEQLQDLFGKRKVLDVTMDPTGGYRCKDAVAHDVNSPAEALKVYGDGCKQRATASTKMNAESSRSHALLIVNVAWSKEKEKSFAQLNLVDLAGSEGMKKTGATGANAKEGIKINLSLTKLALVVKCLSEGASHVPYRESKLTMMLQKGLGGNNMLHIILALSNSTEQIAEGTACLRFGQSCLNMTINPNANAVEKEQAEMRAVIQEQLTEIADLQSENEKLKRELDERKTKETEVPDFLIAKHIALNKDALSEDLKEADEQINELKRALEEKRKEKERLAAAGDGDAELEVNASAKEQMAGLDAQQRAEALEKQAKEQMIARMKAAAQAEQEQKAFEAELQQMLEIQQKLQDKLASADKEKAEEEERIRREAEEHAEMLVMEMEEKAARMEMELKQREEAQRAMVEEQRKKEEQLQAQLAEREQMLKREEEQRKALEEATQSDNRKMLEELEALRKVRETQEAEIERTKREAERMAAIETEAALAREEARKQEAKMAEELRKMQEELARQRAELEEQKAAAVAEAKAAAEASRQADGAAHAAQTAQADGLELLSSNYKSAKEMIRRAARKLEIAGRAGKVDPIAVGRVIETLPVLVACNDLRALTELEPANKSVFQDMGGIIKLVDYLYPHGPQAPYATHIARTIPCVMDAEGRRLFGQYASGKDAHGVVRLTYLSALLNSSDPDDKEHACLAIASIAQDSSENRALLFEHGLSAEVLAVFRDTSAQKLPRQRLQRVAVMALSDLAQDFEPFQSMLLAQQVVSVLLKLSAPTNDPFIIKETLSCIARITQGNAAIQQELQQLNATAVYSQLLFAQMHDSAITELAGLALVNLVSEAPQSMGMLEQHPKFNSIRFEMLAALGRALSASMMRQGQVNASVAGSDSFKMWGAATVGQWDDSNAGGDRTHTTFVDNPQILLRAKPGTNLCIVLHDTLEDTKQRDRGKARPLFLRLCVTAATPEVLSSRLKLLDINASGNRPAPLDADSIVQLDADVNGFIDVAKTREITLRCAVKSAAPDDMWVVVPHVGCSHQHSQYTLAVFADQPVSLEGQLANWQKRIITSSWTPLCCAPRSISDARWRNCPQFQLINMGTEPTTIRALLSYGERDAALNARYANTVDASPASADERPMLSMYVMKNNVPDRRYVGNLSPQADNYVCHSMVTNSWCVQCKPRLEPGNVYALLVVMAEGTTSKVPLRLTLYSSPELDDGTVLAKPLSTSAEWHVSFVKGYTDANGMTVVDMLPTEGNTQVTAVLESEDASAFCSIATTTGGVPHKQTPTYAQKSAVLSVPLVSGEKYTMVTRTITQRQEPIRQGEARLYVYSSRALQLTPAANQQLRIDEDEASKIVSRQTADKVIYGEETVPEDCVKPKEPDTKDQEAGYDPRVLQDVVAELEAQRDTLFNFTAQAVRGEGPRVVEALRAEVEELKGEKDKITKELEATRSVAKMESLGAQQRKVQQQVQAAAQMKLGVLTHELAAVKKSHAELEAELEAVRAQQGAAPVADAEATAALQSQLRELQTKLQLCEAQRDAALAEKAAAAARLEAAAATSMSNTSTSSAEVTRLQAEIERLKASNTARAAPPAAAEAKDDTAAKIARLERLNAEQAQQLNEISAKGDQKSAACVLQ